MFKNVILRIQVGTIKSQHQMTEQTTFAIKQNVNIFTIVQEDIFIAHLKQNEQNEKDGQV